MLGHDRSLSASLAWLANWGDGQPVDAICVYTDSNDCLPMQNRTADRELIDREISFLGFETHAPVLAFVRFCIVVHAEPDVRCVSVDLAAPFQLV
jgi:hypothetical protein